MMKGVFGGFGLFGGRGGFPFEFGGIEDMEYHEPVLRNSRMPRPPTEADSPATPRTFDDRPMFRPRPPPRGGAGSGGGKIYDI